MNVASSQKYIYACELKKNLNLKEIKRKFKKNA